MVEPTPGAGPRYDRGVIWEPFVLALFLGLIVSAGLDQSPPITLVQNWTAGIKE